MKVNVLYVDVSAKFGGSIVSLLSRLNHMDRDKFRPVVLCRAGPQADAFKELGVETQAVKVPRFPSRSSFRIYGLKVYNPLHLPRHSLILLGVLTAASKLSRNERFDVIHGSGLFSNLYASIAGFIFRKPVVWHINDFDPQKNRATFLLLSRKTAKVIAISKTVERMLIDLGIGREKIVMIYQPVDYKVFHHMKREECRKRLGLNSRKKIVGFLGRLEPEKGFDHFLRAGAEIVKRRPETTLLVAGEGYNRAYLRRISFLVDSLDLREKIIFLGLRRDTPCVFNALDVLVFPSVCDEAFGRILAEAALCGLPTVATDVGAVREIVQDGVTGVLVPRRDTTSMAREVISLLQNGAQASRMGCVARERVKRLFSPELHVWKLEKVYEEISKI